MHLTGLTSTIHWSIGSKVSCDTEHLAHKHNPNFCGMDWDISGKNHFVSVINQDTQYILRPYFLSNCFQNENYSTSLARILYTAKWEAHHLFKKIIIIIAHNGVGYTDYFPLRSISQLKGAGQYILSKANHTLQLKHWTAVECSL